VATSTGGTRSSPSTQRLGTAALSLARQYHVEHELFLASAIVLGCNGIAAPMSVPQLQLPEIPQLSKSPNG